MGQPLDWSNKAVKQKWGGSGRLSFGLPLHLFFDLLVDPVLFLRNIEGDLHLQSDEVIAVLLPRLLPQSLPRPLYQLSVLAAGPQRDGALSPDRGVGESGTQDCLQEGDLDPGVGVVALLPELAAFLRVAARYPHVDVEVAEEALLGVLVALPRQHHLLVVGCAWLDEDQLFRRLVDLSLPVAALAVGLADRLVASAAAAEAVVVLAAVEPSACALGAFDLSEGGLAPAGGADDPALQLDGLSGKQSTLCTPVLAYECVSCISMLISNFLKLAAFLCCTTVSSSSSSSSCSSCSSCSSYSSQSSHGVSFWEELQQAVKNSQKCLKLLPLKWFCRLNSWQAWNISSSNGSLPASAFRPVCSFLSLCCLSQSVRGCCCG